jgi:hypothetical protein
VVGLHGEAFMSNVINAVLTLKDAVRRRDEKIKRMLDIINSLDNTYTKKILIERLCDEGIAKKVGPEKASGDKNS